MQITTTYELPEELNDFKQALHSREAFDALSEIRKIFRELHKGVINVECAIQQIKIEILDDIGGMEY